MAIAVLLVPSPDRRTLAGQGMGRPGGRRRAKQAVASLPPVTDKTGLTEAEATGRRGELMNNGTTISLSSMAQQSKTSEQDLCTRMASSAKMVATQRSSMPTVPSGTAMPSLPPGMTMPAISGMTMPGMPKAP